MTTLGNYHHDFPRLAKQSGYFFQLYRGRVNWLEIESLNIDDITENRNFQLLEHNLLNVINCNLEREYDLKILDQNFVKLFKLAQLGVDYLSYCQLYLDRCVILLQEQLLAIQEEFAAMKLENQKKTDELRKTKKKTRTQSYQCDKCEKIFISDVYLKFHDKRRHSTPNTPKSAERPLKKYVDNCQQTEDKRILSASTQTLFLDKEVAERQESEEIIKIKKEHNLKIEKLESELEDLKVRLKKAENTLTEKTDHSSPGLPHSYNFPAPIYYPSMLQFIPPYVTQSQGSCYEINPGYQMSALQTAQPSKHSHDSINVEIPKPRSPKQVTPGEINPPKEPTDLQDDAAGGGKENSIPNEVENENKENKDPTRDNPRTRPQPLPRKTKNINHAAGERTRTEPLTVHPLTDSVSFNNQSITSSSTPIKEKHAKPETPSESRESLARTEHDGEMISNESLNEGGTNRKEHKSRSFIKKMVTRNSPRLHKLGIHFKKSLTNLYDSVSSTGKDSIKIKESWGQDPKAAVVGELNSQLREMGVDPEWSGIPEGTMRQKLKALKHKRNLLSKENPAHPLIRQNLEERIFKKLRKTFTVGKPAQEKEFNEQESTETQASSKPEETSGNEQSKVVKVKKSSMYDTDSDTDTKVSDLDDNLDGGKETPTQNAIFVKDLESESEDKLEKQFDLSVFQVAGGRTKSVGEGRQNEGEAVDELLTDSDFDDDFLGNFETRDFRSVHSGEQGKEEPRENAEPEQREKPAFLFLQPARERPESQSILKGIPGPQPMTSKKKVLFADQESSDLSDSNDDLWSLKSDLG